MAKRLTRIYTRTGDNGTTGLADRSRVPKNHLRVEAIGTVDELNTAVGLLLVQQMPEAMRASFVCVQHDLFDLGGELSLPGHAIIGTAHIERLERELDALNAQLPPLEEFVLPGGSPAAAAAHFARAVCRRAERTLVALDRSEALAAPLLQYLNRLSDLLFVAARALNRHAGHADVRWEQGKSARGGSDPRS